MASFNATVACIQNEEKVPLQLELAEIKMRLPPTVSPGFLEFCPLQAIRLSLKNHSMKCKVSHFVAKLACLTYFAYELIPICIV